MRVLTVLLALTCLAGCRPEMTCGSFATTGSSHTSRRSVFRATQCEDGRTYSVDCLRPASAGTYACTCRIDGAATGATFHRPTPMPSPEGNPVHALAAANTGCSWHLGD